MASSSEEDQRPEIAVGDIPRVAELIASIPGEQRAAALRAADFSYTNGTGFRLPRRCRAAVGCGRASKLRLEVDKQRWTIRMRLKLVYRETMRAALGTESSDEAAVTQLSGALFISW
jgi:hypothetical protein